MRCSNCTKDAKECRCTYAELYAARLRDIWRQRIEIAKRKHSHPSPTPAPRASGAKADDND